MERRTPSIHFVCSRVISERPLPFAFWAIPFPVSVKTNTDKTSRCRIIYRPQNVLRDAAKLWDTKHQNYCPKVNRRYQAITLIENGRPRSMSAMGMLQQLPLETPHSITAFLCGRPLPAMVMILPDGSTRRMRLCAMSVIYRLPTSSTATPVGLISA
jgi:hypothetical protein